jgi:hypothetical protein
MLALGLAALGKAASRGDRAQMWSPCKRITWTEDERWPIASPCCQRQHLHHLLRALGLPLILGQFAQQKRIGARGWYCGSQRMNNGKLAMSNSHQLITDYRDYRARITKFGEHRVREVFAGGLLMKIHSAPDGSRIVSALFDPGRDFLQAFEVCPNGRPVPAPHLMHSYTSKPELT